MAQATDIVALAALALLLAIGIAAGLLLWLREVSSVADSDRNVP